MGEARRRACAADSWAGRAIREWTARADDGAAVIHDDDARERLVRRLEDDAGAPETPGWE